MKNDIPSFLLERPAADSFKKDRGKAKALFIEKGINRIASVIQTGYIQAETASGRDFFQRLDARVKVLFLLFFVVIISLKRDIMPEVLIWIFIFLLALFSRLCITSLYKRVFFFGFVFGFLVALPSSLNIITDGEVILPVLHLSKPYDLWFCRIPKEIGFTREGMSGVMLLTSRVMNSLALSFLVLYTTPFHEIIKALRLLKVPDGFLIIITLSYKYIFIFAKIIEDMHLAKKSRMAGHVSDGTARIWIAGRMAVLFKKTMTRSEEVFKAMLSRGFSGNVKIYGAGKLNAQDRTAAVVFLLAGLVFLWI